MSEHKESNPSLFLSQAKNAGDQFRMLADASPVMVWTTDTKGKGHWFSNSWLKFTGRTLEQERGDGWIEGLHADDRSYGLAIYQDHFEKRLPFEMEYRLRRHDGVHRWILDRGSPVFGEDGTFHGYVGGCIDIHERREIADHREELLKIEQAARAEAERIATMKDEFLATVSHEMRTPLTAILGWVQLLRRGDVPQDVIPQAHEAIERNARVQAQLIEDLLDMSRILSGQMKLEIQHVDAWEAIDSAIATTEPAAAAKRITLHRDMDLHAGAVSADPIRLRQIAGHLLSNAIKFTPTGGEVTVKLERVDSLIEFSVSDTGEGIAGEFLPYVFDRFRQQDASTVRKHQGLGLGLSLVKQLVELHGGLVSAKSDGLGKGSTFTVAFPAISAPAVTVEKRPSKHDSSQPEEPPPSLLGTKVLVVDDDGDTREILRSILAHRGASVRTAASVDEALKSLQDRLPDVLVSDIGMPGEDGYDLIKKVRSLDRESGGRIPAVALTAFARSGDRRRAISAGFHMHLAKPIEPAELVTVVASLAGR